MVDDLGSERVQALGFVDAESTPELADLSAGEIGALARALDTCIDRLDDVLVDAMKGGMLDEASSDLPLSDPEADCTARAIVDGFGTERLMVTSITGGDDPFTDGTLSDEEAQIVAGGFVECVDLRSVFVSQFQAEGLPAEASACLAAEIPDENLRELFAAQFSGESVDPDTLLGPATAVCGLE